MRFVAATVLYVRTMMDNITYQGTVAVTRYHTVPYVLIVISARAAVYRLAHPPVLLCAPVPCPAHSFFSTNNHSPSFYEYDGDLICCFDPQGRVEWCVNPKL
jgi:hypothetical protein